jgi:carbon monoxide dehydrogenase subunit G
MQLTNSFTIARPADEVYKVFLDVERIATCMPGSTLLGQPDPGTYEGEVKVKVGPLSVVYAGQFVVVSANDAARRLKMRAVGREKRGAGSAEAQIVAKLTESEGQTTVQIDTDLDIRGKVAQFGRGVISEVTDGIMTAFAGNVESMLNGAQASPVSGVGVAPPAPPSSRSPRPASAEPRGPAAAENDGLDAWSLIMRPLLRKHGSGMGVVALTGLAAWLGARAGARSDRACS